MPIERKPGASSTTISGQQNHPARKGKTSITTSPICVICKAKHSPWKCPAFQEKTPTERTKTSSKIFPCLLPSWETIIPLEPKIF